MPNLEQITTLINTGISTGRFKSMKFSTGRYLTVADAVKTEPAEGSPFMRPGIIDNEGHVTSIAIDDKYPFTIYHVIDRLEYTPDQYGSPNKAGWGVQETAEMRLVFLGDQKKMKVRPEQVAAALQMDMLRELTPAQWALLSLTSATIEVTDTNLDKYAVWSKEFEGCPDKVKPQHMLLAISYRIVSTFNNKCFSIC